MYLSRIVNIGNIPLGGNLPVRVQTMTNTNTLDTESTVNQCIRSIEAGADYVRITTPTIKEAENLQLIKNQLRARGFNTPLIADVHFNPKVAEICARIVEKVRINPGNYVDKKQLGKIDYSDSEYQFEIENIHKRILPLLKICKQYGTAIRIGTNHGSLSDRIVSRYGDTPQGMVEATMEFLRICHSEQFHNIVISLKASNPLVMIDAYRLIAKQMTSENMNYPLHLGVTEAGDGEDGRIKSAVGICTLLSEGLGDTIRVSLTEAPEAEIPVAKKMVAYFGQRSEDKISTFANISSNRNYFQIIDNHNFPIVIGFIVNKNILTTSDFEDIGFYFDRENLVWKRSDIAPDIVYIADKQVDIDSESGLNLLVDEQKFVENDSKNRFPLLSLENFATTKSSKNVLTFLKISNQDVDNLFIEKFSSEKQIVFVLIEKPTTEVILELQKLNKPVVLKNNYQDTDLEAIQLKSAGEIGKIFINGFGNGIWIEAPEFCVSNKEFIKVNSLMFSILQSCRLRISKTEYISCPSCGRTLFDLETATSQIKQATGHLKGLKIGIMGCIVNGPGEMADADYGYVGSGVGKITLYKRKEIVKRNISQQNAVNELIQLIKDSGDWKDI